MMRSRLVFLLVTLVGLPAFAHATCTAQQKDGDEAVKRFLSSQKSETESAESQGDAIADLNGDGKSEIILVWTLMGPTYWHNTLTILSKVANGYKDVASFQLIGEAKLSKVKDGIIIVDQTVYAKNDPLCCPSIKKQMKYRLVGKRISEVK
jgi:hypothetical protein